MGNRVCGVFKEEEMDPRDLLCQFWVDTHRLCNMQENVAQKMLYLGPSP
jgi:hypothetical protein